MQGSGSLADVDFGRFSCDEHSMLIDAARPIVEGIALSRDLSLGEARLIMSNEYGPKEFEVSIQTIFWAFHSLFPGQSLAEYIKGCSRVDDAVVEFVWIFGIDVLR